jgi:hypothetical protein
MVNELIGSEWFAITRAYHFNQEMDLGQFNPYSKFMLVNTDMVYFYVNLPVRYEYVDYFVRMDTTTKLV